MKYMPMHHRKFCVIVVNLGEKNGVSRKFIITSELLKTFEVDSSHMPLSSEVKSS